MDGSWTAGRFPSVRALPRPGPPVSVAAAPAEAPVRAPEEELAGVTAPDVPWVTLVWNDPVNLMSYVAHVFRTHFGYSRAKAEKLMRAVHEEGRAVVSTGTREEMERDTEAMHSYGLWATFRKDE